MLLVGCDSAFDANTFPRVVLSKLVCTSFSFHIGSIIPHSDLILDSIVSSPDDAAEDRERADSNAGSVRSCLTIAVACIFGTTLAYILLVQQPCPPPLRKTPSRAFSISRIVSHSSIDSDPVPALSLDKTFAEEDQFIGL